MQDFAKKNKPIAAICHGAQVLAAANILKGRSCAAYQAVGPEINSAGGKWVNIGLGKNQG